MTDILYYSNYCNNSKELIKELSSTDVAKDIHFLCIDSRVQENGKTYIVLGNGKKMILPPNVVRVPTLLSLEENGRLYSGMEIKDHLRSKITKQVKKATMEQMEPTSFSFGGGSNGIVSDNYSFLDMEASDLTATGSGGMRQLHSYVTVDDMANITAPTESYGTKQDSSKSQSLESIRNQRDMDLKMFSK